MKYLKFNRPPADPEAEQLFRSLDSIFSLSGKFVYQGDLSDLLYIPTDRTAYYVKRYYQAGKGIRRFIGCSRLRGEWKNLKRFEAWSIPTTPLVAYGRNRTCLGHFKCGTLITQELCDTATLAEMANRADPKLTDRTWIAAISGQVTTYTRLMHDHRFAHGDLKWRNVLVTNDDNPEVRIFDCPAGKHWAWPFLQYRKNKDLACLDKVAKKVLTRTQRLRFFLDYLEQDRLDRKSKNQLRRIIRFFSS